jgi:hypothetical protein
VCFYNRFFFSFQKLLIHCTLTAKSKENEKKSKSHRRSRSRSPRRRKDDEESRSRRRSYSRSRSPSAKREDSSKPVEETEEEYDARLEREEKERLAQARLRDLERMKRRVEEKPSEPGVVRFKGEIEITSLYSTPLNIPQVEAACNLSTPSICDDAKSLILRHLPRLFISSFVIVFPSRIQ